METTKLHDLSFEAICGIIAKVIHSANRAYVDAIGGRAINLTWEEIREEERQGLIKAISSMIINPRTPEVSHEHWCLAREKDGWTKDLKYDYNRKTHPNMVPYDQLPFEEQFKDHLFMGIASIFYGALGMEDMDDIKAARNLIQAEFAKQSEADKIDAEEEIDPVDTEATIILKEKIKATQDEIERLSGIPSDVRKDEEIKPNLPDQPDQVINGVTTLGFDGKTIEQVEQGDNKETPLPTADEILDHKPKDYTAKDLAEDVLGANNVGVVDGVGSGEINITDTSKSDVVSPLPGEKGDRTKEKSEEGVKDTPTAKPKKKKRPTAKK